MYDVLPPGATSAAAAVAAEPTEIDYVTLEDVAPFKPHNWEEANRNCDIRLHFTLSYQTIQTTRQESPFRIGDFLVPIPYIVLTAAEPSAKFFVQAILRFSQL